MIITEKHSRKRSIALGGPLNRIRYPARYLRFEDYLKSRFVGFFVASVAIIVLVPAIAVVSFIVFVCFGRSIIIAYAGQDAAGQPVTLYRFRTERAETGADQPLARENDLQRFRFEGRTCGPANLIGCMLEKSGLVDLPRLYNLLRGDVSVRDSVR